MEHIQTFFKKYELIIYIFLFFFCLLLLTLIVFNTAGLFNFTEKHLHINYDEIEVDWKKISFTRHCAVLITLIPLLFGIPTIFFELKIFTLISIANKTLRLFLQFFITAIILIIFASIYPWKWIDPVLTIFTSILIPLTLYIINQSKNQNNKTEIFVYSINKQQQATNRKLNRLNK